MAIHHYQIPVALTKPLILPNRIIIARILLPHLVSLFASLYVTFTYVNDLNISSIAENYTEKNICTFILHVFNEGEGVDATGN